MRSTYPKIDNVSPDLMYELSHKTDEVKKNRAIYDFSDKYGIYVTVIPVVEDDDSIEWQILVSEEKSAINGKVKKQCSTVEEFTSFISTRLDKL